MPMAMEIPTDMIHRLQSSLREAAGACSSSAAPPPPFLSVTDAVAAFDSSSASPELRCERCGAAGGLLLGTGSAVCVYCGSARRGEDGGGDAGVAFRDSGAYGWLLGPLGLDGSELVDLDTEPTDSSKSKEAPKSGMVLSDLLDLKLTWPPENKETSVSSRSIEQPSATYALHLSGVDLDSFFTERKEITPAAAFPQTHATVQEKQSTHSRTHQSSRSEVYVSSQGSHCSGMKITSPHTNQIEATPGFANWDADFQSAGSETVVRDSKQVDLFQTPPCTEPFSFPAVGATIKPVVATENETKVKSTSLEHSEDLPSATCRLVEDNLFNQNIVQPISENYNRTIPQNNAAEISESPLGKNSVQSDHWPGRCDTGGSIDEDFDDWQEFTGGKNQCSISNSDQIEGSLKSDISGIKTEDPWPISSTGSSNDVNGDSFDDWQAFAASSGQGGLAKPVGETSSGQGGGEMASISFEHSSETKSADLWSLGNVEEHISTEMVKETNDTFDDWQDFTSSGQAHETSLNQAEDRAGASHTTHKEIESVDSWFTGNIKESGNTDLVNGNNVSLDDWQGFTGSGQAQKTSSNLGGEMMNISNERHEETETLHSWVNGNNRESRNTELTNTENSSFDIWQDFTTPAHPQEMLSDLREEIMSAPSEPAKDINSMDLWLTSNSEESKSGIGVDAIDDSSDGWQDFASFGQAQGSMQIPGEGQPSHSIKDPSGPEPLDLWASGGAKEYKNFEQMNENNDLFEDWQDFKNSSPQKTGLPTLADASLLDSLSASQPDTISGVEFGSFAHSASSQNQVAKNESSNEANTVPSDAHFERMNEIQQMHNVDPLSTIQPTTSPDNNSVSKQEPVNANVERLLSQMHDLSFMLKDELSVPDEHVDRQSKP